jgi:hypothetical protein
VIARVQSLAQSGHDLVTYRYSFDKPFSIAVADYAGGQGCREYRDRRVERGFIMQVIQFQ